jgi:type IV pilus assembly protein PilV
MKRAHTAVRGQSGFMLLEVLVSILIFSLGVLAVVGLQAASAKDSSQAKYRADATMLVNDLVGRMWASNRNVGALTTAFATDGTGASYDAWLADAQATLPGIDTTQTSVVVTPVTDFPGAGQTAQVAITLAWKAPNEPPSGPVHQLTFVTRISN